MSRATLLLTILLAGCLGHFELRAAPPAPFDATIVLGCPSQDDGRPTLCQLGRALWASIVWERGYTKFFITTGNSVHSAYIEADAIAQLMVAAGVPADRIYLEVKALHTDENVYNSIQIARAMHWQKLAVLSDAGHAAFGCKFVVELANEYDCSALSVDRRAVIAKHRALGAALDAIRAPRDPAYLPIEEREHRIYLTTGRRRPPSFLLYPSLAIMRTNGEAYIPYSLSAPTLLRYSERLSH